MYRIGQGIDFHQLEEGRDLWLGGVKVPHIKGCIAHSDGDVLLHAICDALLGSLGLGDIGIHFPNTDPVYQNADSKVLLQRCYNMVREKGYWLVNVDSTLVLEEPKIKPYVQQMQQTIAGLLHLNTDDVSIKATTAETMGAIGRSEGIMAMATVLVQHY